MNPFILALAAGVRGRDGVVVRAGVPLPWLFTSLFRSLGDCRNLLDEPGAEIDLFLDVDDRAS